MKINFRITSKLLKKIHSDLSRPHAYAAERVGFLSCGVSKSPENNLLILGQNYHPVSDDHYINDPRYGAMIGSPAISHALQLAYQQPISMFHIHRHDHYGIPKFSPIDMHESNKLIPDFWNVQPNRPHGILLLSHDAITGLCWHPNNKDPVPIDSFSLIKQTSQTYRWTT